MSSPVVSWLIDQSVGQSLRGWRLANRDQRSPLRRFGSRSGVETQWAKGVADCWAG